MLSSSSLAYDNFLNSIRSEATRNQYVYLLGRYMKFIKEDNLLLAEIKAIESNIIKYIVWLKSDQKLSAITINQYLAAIIHFYSMNDITLNRKKIGRYMGDYIRTNKDRAYTNAEIQRLLGFLDERTKALVLLLASSGVRIGAIPELCLRHIKKIEEYALYRLSIYEGTKDEYYCFTTPEAATAIDTYLESRTRLGEKLTDNSPLFRQQFESIDARVKNPKIMNVKALSKLLEDKLYRSGVSSRVAQTESIKPGQIRHTVVRAHGFRKFVTTNMIRAKVNAEAREMLLGHSIGLNKAYYRPGEDEILAEYLKAVDLLTINEENRLKRKIETLEVEKSQIDQLKADLAALKNSFMSSLSSSSDSGE